MGKRAHLSAMIDSRICGSNPTVLKETGTNNREIDTSSTTVADTASSSTVSNRMLEDIRICRIYRTILDINRPHQTLADKILIVVVHLSVLGLIAAVEARIIVARMAMDTDVEDIMLQRTITKTSIRKSAVTT